MANIQVKLIGMIYAPQLGIVTEFCANGSLDKYKDSHASEIDIEWKISKLIGIARGNIFPG